MDREKRESELGQKLCAELLSAAELKEICRIRGFPITGSAKQGLVDAVAARLLEPLGVVEAMAAIERRWLAALHLVAAVDAPVPVGDLGWVVELGKRRYDTDLRALWRMVASGLLSKGVLLVDDAAAPGRWEKSRYARYRLILPLAFRTFLPPFPMPAEPVNRADERGCAAELQRRALALFIAETGSKQKRAVGLDLVERFAALLSLKNGLLRIGDLGRPTAEQLLAKLAVCWEDSLKHHGNHSAPLAAGRMACHILRHLPPGHGCRPDALAEALGELGVAVAVEEVAAFCDEGAGAGLCRRFSQQGATLLYAADATREEGAADTALALAPHPKGVTVQVLESSLEAVLEAASVSRASRHDGALLLEPDPVRIGRAADSLERSRIVASLRSASPAFDTAAKTVLARRGQVILHRGLMVLRVDDVGLRALIARRFATAVREVAGAYLAVLQSRGDEVLAFAKKEGYVARIQS